MALCQKVELDQHGVGCTVDIDWIGFETQLCPVAARVSTSSSRTMVGPLDAVSAIDCENRSDTARCVLPWAELVRYRLDFEQLEAARRERSRHPVGEASRK